MNQNRITTLLGKFFSSSITKSQFDEMKRLSGEMSDADLSGGLQQVWNEQDFGKAMPFGSKERIKRELGRTIGRDRFVRGAVKFSRVAAAIAIPVLLATTIYLFTERKAYVGQQAQLLNVSVAKGEHATVNLPDGSTVMLNSESKLYYPSNFTTKERWIQLEGEAYFHVQKSHGRPFTVKTKSLNVRVLGTTFNVSAYSNEPVHSVVLVNGSVAVNAQGKQPYTIKPNEMFALETGSGKAVVTDVESYSYTSWRDGILSFESEPITNVLEKVSRQFNVALQYDPRQFKNDKLTGKLDLNEGVESALRVISLASPMTFVKHKNKIVITARP
jgi:transmembrane sensor